MTSPDDAFPNSPDGAGGSLKGGTRLGDYRLDRLLGAGAMGEVYLARQLRLDQVCAVKILPPELTSSPDFEKRFESEGRALAKLDHANIVRVLYAGLDQGRHFLSMEYVDGGSLEDHIHSHGGRIPVAGAVPILRDILSGLAFAHARGVVHRDLKPANILRTRGGCCKISDFGLALVAGEAYMQSIVQKSIVAESRLSMLRSVARHGDDETLAAETRRLAPSNPGDAETIAGPGVVRRTVPGEDETIANENLSDPAARSRGAFPSRLEDGETIAAGETRGAPGSLDQDLTIAGDSGTGSEAETMIRGAGNSGAIPASGRNSQHVSPTQRPDEAAAFVGTLLYMSPEVHEHRPADARSDIYAVGVIAYEMMTGVKPRGRAKAPSKLAEGLSADWDAWVFKCMESDPDDRFQSAAQALESLPSAELAAPMPAKRRSKARVLAFASVVAILCVAVAGYVLRGPIAGLLSGESAATGGTSSTPVREKPAAQAPAPSATPGALVVKSLPSGAEVRVESQPVRTTPAAFDSLPPGPYRMDISMPGYESFSTSAVVESGRTTTLPAFSLIRQTGALSISSGSPDTEWRLLRTPDGQQPDRLSGVTPVTLTQVPTGSYTVEFHRAGWPRAQEEVTVAHGATQSVSHEFASGTLSILGNIEGAAWKIVSSPAPDAPARQGTVPDVIGDLPEGAYTIEFSLDGWKSLRVESVVKAGSQSSASAAFPTGSVEVISTPDGAEVSDDSGRLLGSTPLSIRNFPPGAVKLKVSKSGGGSAEVTGDLAAGSTLQLSCDVSRSPALDILDRSVDAAFECRFDDALSGFTKVIEDPSAPAFARAEALVDRADIIGNRMEIDKALADYSAVIDMADAPPAKKARAYYGRAGVRNLRDGSTSGESDYASAGAEAEKALATPDLSVDDKAFSLMMRGMFRARQQDLGGALQDLDEALGMDNLAVRMKAMARFYRGLAQIINGNRSGAMEDFAATGSMEGASPDIRAIGYSYKASCELGMGATDAALKDYQAAGEIRNVPDTIAVDAHLGSAAIFERRGDFGNAQNHYNDVVAMGFKIQPLKRAMAFVGRAKCRVALGDKSGALADYNQIISMKEAPADSRAAALNARGRSFLESGNVAAALGDFSKALSVEGATLDSRLAAMLGRAEAYSTNRQFDVALDEYNAVLKMKGLTPSQQAETHLGLSMVYGN
ncbi:MAG TPA: protein kinase, partial [Opitutales bacterium]|nr:protein kinase [Opitutales bacterium]